MPGLASILLASQYSVLKVPAAPSGAARAGQEPNAQGDTLLFRNLPVKNFFRKLGSFSIEALAGFPRRTEFGASAAPLLEKRSPNKIPGSADPCKTLF